MCVFRERDVLGLEQGLKSISVSVEGDALLTTLSAEWMKVRKGFESR